MTDSPPSNFEDALSQLDDIVESLEEKGVPLTDLIDQYDRGMKLLESCQSQLENARQRVATISQAYLEAVGSDEAGEVAELPSEKLNDELF